ncbi:putative WSC domain-containing protein [Iris pallida]|uniref:WSC domain-containing protein n=1 Tax=Iris pallida TaxID=29817 RepID=A0AAX6ERX6_IRIPA|nr:putative WSC domain-containing protein [Iris pallida]
MATYKHLLLLLLITATCAQLPGRWQTLLESAGIASMHTAVTRFGTVVLLDRTEIGPSNLTFPDRQCGPRHDCTAHSALFDPATNVLRPLTIATDTWCSSGQFLPDGTLLQTGGDMAGIKKMRTFSPCGVDGACDWLELKSISLTTGRWYATNQILPNGTVIIVGGRAAHSVEFYPPSATVPIRDFPFLAATEDPQLDNLYPYVHLLPDGNLFVFANTKSILYDFDSGATLRAYPDLGTGPWTYPSAGSSVMLALNPEDGYSKAVIVICGGTSYGVFFKQDVDFPARTTCGRIVATDPDPSWATEDMPMPRVMGDMVMLPTGETLIINGAMSGSQGFEGANNPCQNPVLYRPNQPDGLRFMTLTPTDVPRMYHSTANLLADGRVLVAGSNPHYFYKFYNVSFPTELRLEAFSPEYLDDDKANIRPTIEMAPDEIRHGAEFDIEVTTELSLVGIVELNLASAPFATHSFSQGQRLVRLEVTPPSMLVEGGGANREPYRYRIGCKAPPNGNVAPPGYYMAFAVNNGVPSVAKWVHLVL